MIFRYLKRRRLQKRHDELVAMYLQARKDHARSSEIARELRMVTARLLVT